MRCRRSACAGHHSYFKPPRHRGDIDGSGFIIGGLDCWIWVLSILAGRFILDPAHSPGN
jgi:hypothetical protein